MALPLAPVCRIIYWVSKRTAPLHFVFLVRGYRGKASEGHLRTGTRVVAVKRWKEATSYVERYMAKPEEFSQGLETGRIWGIWNKELLPVQWERVEVSLRDAFRIRRIYRRLAERKGSGSLRHLTVFVRYENVVRLLRLLGYRLE